MGRIASDMLPTSSMCRGRLLELRHQQLRRRARQPVGRACGPRPMVKINTLDTTMTLRALRNGGLCVALATERWVISKNRSFLANLKTTNCRNDHGQEEATQEDFSALQ